MYIGIMVFEGEGEKLSAGVVRLIETAEKMGHKVDVFFEDSLTLRLDIDKIFLYGEPLPEFDVVLTRPNTYGDPRMRTMLVEAIAKQGIPVINGAASILEVKNKAHASTVLARSGIKMPKTAVVYHESDALKIAEEWGFPLVLKTPYGSAGIGVLLAESSVGLGSLVEFLRRRAVGNDPVIIQEFIEEAKCSDHRLLVVGGKVVASMKRQGGKEEFRSNWHRGGSVSNYNPTKEEIDLAIKATSCLHLDIAGVDILPSKQGPLLLEVNANPGFSGLEQATGLDIAKEIVLYIEAQARRN